MTGREESVMKATGQGFFLDPRSFNLLPMIEGASIKIGKEKLYGATVAAHDLRAGAALVIAGLMAEGTTTVENIHFIERGYENLVEKLTALGAKIRTVD